MTQLWHLTSEWSVTVQLMNQNIIWSVMAPFLSPEQHMSSYKFVMTQLVMAKSRHQNNFWAVMAHFHQNKAHEKDLIIRSDRNVVNKSLQAWGSTPLYLCLPPLRCSAGGDCYFPSICVCIWRYLRNIRKPLKCINSCFTNTCAILLSRRPTLPVDHPRWLASLTNLGSLCKK